MASATPDLRLPPSQWRVPIYTAWWTEANCVWTTCQESLREAEQSGLKPATSRWQVRRPNHYATTPHIYGRGFKIQKFVPLALTVPQFAGILLSMRCDLTRSISVQNLKCLASFVPKMRRQSIAISRWANGCAKTITNEFRSFLSDLHKIWLNTVEWSMLNVNVLDFRYVISNIVYTSILAMHGTTGWITYNVNLYQVETFL